MKRALALAPALVLAVSAIALAPTNVAAQAPEGAAPAAGAKEKLVDINKVEINIQKTPQMQVQNMVKDKRWLPKDWLEIEVEATAELSKTEKDKNKKSYDDVTFKYFVYLQGATKDKSRVLTAEVTHVNVPIKEKIHSVVYISPSQIQKLADTNAAGLASPNMVKAWGVQAFINGQEVGRKTSEANKEWWTNSALPAQEAALLDKTQTPFAPLWGDYHLEVKAR